MDSVVLIADQSFTLQELFVKLRAQWPKTYTNSLGRIVVEEADKHLYLEVYTDAAEEYGSKELENIRKLIPFPCFYSIDYRDGDLVRRVLSTVADDPRCVVDNDAGTILPGPTFVRRLREEPWWDWFEEFRRNTGDDGERDLP